MPFAFWWLTITARKSGGEALYESCIAVCVFASCGVLGRALVVPVSHTQAQAI